MAANLTPQYLEAEEAFKKAQTPEERLEWLRKMYTLLPKHKASEKLQADLKTRISEAKKEVEQAKKSPKKSGLSFKIPRQGAGQYLVLGGPNVGKSSVLAKLTRANPEVAPYPFTTHEPNVGMMDWNDVRVQLIDTPPITSDYMEGYISSMVRAADAVVLIVDLGDDDGPFAAEAVIDKLDQVKTKLVGQLPEENDDPSIMCVKTILFANKVDLPDAKDRLEIVREMFADKFPVHVASLETGEEVEELRDTIFKFLNVIRVYTKQPGKPADMTSPFTCPVGSTLIEMAPLVHKDFAENLKSARIWGEGVHDGQSVGRDHVLHDGDVVELHI